MPLLSQEPARDPLAQNGGAKEEGLSMVSNAVFLLSTMSLGVGVFSLPTTMNAVGWVLGVGLCCYFGVLSMALMLLLLGVVEERNIRSWEDLTGLAPVACSLSRVSLLLSLLIGNAAHMQTISGMLFDLMTYFVTDDYGEYHFGVWQRVTLLFIFLGVASPFCFTEDLAALHYVGKSVAGVVLLLCAAVAVSSCIMLARGEEVHSDQATPPVSGDLQVLLSTAPSVCFAFTGMLSFWEVFAALKQGVGVEQALPRMKKTVILSAGLVLVVYLIVSGCCVLAFGQMAGKMHKGSGFGNVLYNFPMDNYPVTLLCAALVVVIVLEYPVINFPLVSMVLKIRALGLDRWRYARHFVSLAGMVVVVLLDLAVPDLPDVFGLCGSLGLSLFCYVVPGYICIVAGRGLLAKVIGALAVLTGLAMLFGGTFFILKRVLGGHR